MSERTRAVNMPRLQAGAHPQHLLATLFGDYDFAERNPVPSAAIVRLLAEFGISAVSARNTLSRLAKRGLILPVRDGRRTSYRMADAAKETHGRRLRHFLTFGAAPVPDTGEWTVVVFSLPESQRDLRRVLRTRLQEIGMASLFDGVWVMPGDRREDAARVLDELSIGPAASLMVAGFASAPAGGRDPVSAFDVDGLRAGYEGFVERYSPLLERVREGAVGLAEALVVRTEIMDAWRVFPDADPCLPTALLPDDWPLGAARGLFLETYDALGPLAELRLRSLLKEYIGERVADVRAYVSADYPPA
ncbi:MULTISPECIES: PaaX family transcriptional regulator C-terminal domain-containing protein [unclassified Spirillospora]|uniref:PaaX family transcriptional regulator n=1 Tax=unclassified Spirillospora TaxID=2642701 RepID=UPI00371A8F97